MRTYRSNAEILALFIDDPLVAPPGTQVSYTSFGYTLASMVMEAAAGKPFLELIDDEIARPFGLASLLPDEPDGDRPEARERLHGRNSIATCCSAPRPLAPS